MVANSPVGGLRFHGRSGKRLFHSHMARFQVFSRFCFEVSNNPPLFGLLFCAAVDCARVFLHVFDGSCFLGHRCLYLRQGPCTRRGWGAGFDDWAVIHVEVRFPKTTPPYLLEGIRTPPPLLAGHQCLGGGRSGLPFTHLHSPSITFELWPFGCFALAMGVEAGGIA